MASAYFRFTGDPQRGNTGPPILEFKGLKFPLNGDAVEVTDEALAEELRTNNHFTEGNAAPRRGRPAKHVEGEGE